MIQVRRCTGSMIRYHGRNQLFQLLDPVRKVCFHGHSGDSAALYTTRICIGASMFHSSAQTITTRLYPVTPQPGGVRMEYRFSSILILTSPFCKNYKLIEACLFSDLEEAEADEDEFPYLVEVARQI